MGRGGGRSGSAGQECVSGDAGGEWGAGGAEGIGKGCKDMQCQSMGMVDGVPRV